MDLQPISVELLRNLPPLAQLDTQPEYIVYCQSGRRSSAAAFLLIQRGFRASLPQGGLNGSRRGETGDENGQGAQTS